MTFHSARLAAGIIVVVVAMLVRPDSVLAQPSQCDIVSLGVDTSLAVPYFVETMGIACGEAGGETFFARDTLIHSIAVWRPSIETPNGAGFKLWITRVDSTGAPNIDAVILSEPVQQFIFGDRVHPIKMQWSFDPPFALPGVGEYYFTVQDYCGGFWDLLVNRDNAFTDGSAWRSEQTCRTDCRLRTFPDSFVMYDLIFTIEFCHNTLTPTLKKSWGRLKLLYR